jgi:hypothetical protein
MDAGPALQVLHDLVLGLRNDLDELRAEVGYMRAEQDEALALLKALAAALLAGTSD